MAEAVLANRRQVADKVSETLARKESYASQDEDGTDDFQSKDAE
jgi:hypothetical protein